MMRIISVFLLLGVISACSGIPQSKFKAASTTRSLLVAQPFVYEEATSVGFNKALLRNTVSSGKYQPVFDDELGTYFKGPAHCFSVSVVDPGWAFAKSMAGKVLRDEDCGIYVPHNPSAEAKLFMILGSQRHFSPTQQPVDTSVAATGAAIQVILNTPNLSPAAAGLGSGLAVGIVEGMNAAEKGNVVVLDKLPVTRSLRTIFVFSQ